MKLNIRKLDERIQKLQEIKRIAADPELVSMLLEFIGGDDDRAESAATATAQQGANPLKENDTEIVNQIMKGLASPTISTISAKRA